MLWAAFHVDCTITLYSAGAELLKNAICVMYNLLTTTKHGQEDEQVYISRLVATGACQKFSFGLIAIK